MAETTETEQALLTIVDEIRWRHPSIRVSCGAFVAGMQLRGLASRQPASMRPLFEVAVVGSPVHTFLQQLRLAGRLLRVPKWADDARMHTIGDVIVGPENVAMVVLPLWHDGEIVGFLRMDAVHPDDLTSSAVEDLRNAAPAALLAVALERERARCWALQRARENLEVKLSERRLREREVGSALQTVLDQLRVRLDPAHDDAQHASIADSAQRIEAAVRTLAETHGRGPIALNSAGVRPVH
ncbi:MAG: GAF domain-containing protein [Nannocystaceae bacterium]|nr:GAF domain-containing protein [Nannocystaceae bacterium]